MKVICPNCSHVFEQGPPKENKISARKKAANIKHMCLDFYCVTETALLSNTRKKEVVACRHMIMALTRKYTSMSYKTIGQTLNRNHTIVIHAEKRLLNSMFTKQDLYHDFLHFQSILENNQLKIAI